MALPFAALGAALLLLQSPSPSPAAAPPSPRRDSIVLRVLTTNDLHGQLSARQEAWSNHRPVGGFAYIKGMMDRLAAECGCVTIRLDDGDMMQGTPVSNLTRGRSTVEAASAMGYAASAIGNHEFDWSIDTLAARIHDAKFAWLSANIILARNHRIPAWATPWRMVQAGPYRIALVGYTTPGTTTSTNPVNVATLGFTGPRYLDSVIGAAQAQHPDFTIVLAHEGAFCNRDTGCQGAVVTLAQQLTHKPDLIVSGHTHSLVTTEVNGIPIIQARWGGTSIGVADFVRTSDGARAVRMDAPTVWADREAPDTAVARIVAGYQRGVDSLTSRLVATLADPLDNDSTLVTMVAEVLRQAAGAQIGLMNATGVRRSLAPGPVTWGDLFETLPFGNFVVKLTLTGAQLRAVAEHAVVGPGDVRARFAGLSVVAADSQGRRVLHLALPDGSAVSDTAHYTLGTEDFLANGGSGYAMLRGLPMVNTGTPDLDAFIAWLKAQPQPVHAPPRSVR